MHTKNWVDFPKPLYAIIRGIQFVLCTLAFTFSFIHIDNLMYTFNSPTLGVAVSWLILSFSLHLSGHLGPALLSTIIDCVLAGVIIIITILAITLAQAITEDPEWKLGAIGTAAAVLNIATGSSLVLTCIIGVVVHRRQEYFKRQGMLGYGRNKQLCALASSTYTM